MAKYILNQGSGDCKPNVLPLSYPATLKGTRIHLSWPFVHGKVQYGKMKINFWRVLTPLLLYDTMYPGALADHLLSQTDRS